MSVDSAAAAIDAPLTDTAGTAVANDDAALDAVWDKHERDNGAERAGDGKFSSPNKSAAQTDEAPPAGSQEPLEGGGGEDAGDTESTPQSSVPLPSNWQSNEMKEAWAKIPPDLQPVIAAHDAKLRETLSKQGNALQTWKPISEIISKNGDYFDGRTAQYRPEDAINAMFETVRQLDTNPVETLVQIATDYKCLDKLAAAFRLDGEDVGTVGTQNAELVAKIGELENTIRALQTGFKPEIVDERVSRILLDRDEHAAAQDAINRTSKDMPLFDDVPEDDMVHYIHRAKAKLNGTGSKDAVLKLAYDMAINADPDLRARAAALKGAAVTDAGKVAAQRNANAANLRSTSTGRPREQTEDEMLDGIWDKHQRA
jgi:hypothetical protein